MDMIFGKRAIIEALRSGVPIDDMLVADNIERDSLVKDILRKAQQKGIEVKYVSRRRLDDLMDSNRSKSSGGADRSDRSKGKTSASHKSDARSFSDERKKDAHQGVVAFVKPFQYASLGDVIAASDANFEKHGCALVVVCDHITDAGNLGAIIRSAESVGAAGLIIPNKRSAQVSATTYKTSAGAVSHLPVAQVANIVSVLDKLKDAGFWVAGATEHSDESIWDTNLEGRIVLVMGNEGDGISRLVLEHCDLTMAIPQRGEISSLNVAQSSTVCMYEWLRQNRQAIKARGLDAD